jgi:hypothetical protein
MCFLVKCYLIRLLYILLLFARVEGIYVFMFMQDQLNLRQVAQLLKRSTKSVRNYIKANKLKASKVESVNGPEYSFLVADVVAFAKESLGIDLVMGEMLEKTISTPTTMESSMEEGDGSQLPTIAYHDQQLDLAQFTQVLLSLENEKIKLIEEFGEYKARLAYKVGQLESQVRQLETGTEEKDKLKKKLVEMEKNYKVRDLDARQLLAMKEFYENRPWWRFWKRFDLQDSERMIGGAY